MAGIHEPINRAQPPCMSCRLKRKKCDRKRPICTRCTELQVPEELCIYRDNTQVFERDSSVALTREQKANARLKESITRLTKLLELCKRGHGHTDEIFTLKQPGGKLLQLHPQRNPLFSTTIESSLTGERTVHMGALSEPALLHSDPRTKLMVRQVNQVLSKERQKYNVDVTGMASSQVLLDVFEERCYAAVVGMKLYDGEPVVNDFLLEIESKLPKKADLESFLYQWMQQNKGRWIGCPCVDQNVVWQQYEDLIHWSPDGTAKLNIRLPDDSHKIEFLSFFLITLAWLTFMRSSRIYPKLSVEEQTGSMNYVLFSRYAQALLRINLLGDSFKMGDLPNSPLTTMTLLIQHLFNRYSAVSDYLNPHDYQTPDPLTTKWLISLAKFQHLNGDVDKWYSRHTEAERRGLKSLWYNIMLLDVLDCLESGSLSSIAPDCYNTDGPHEHPLTIAVATIHTVVYDFNLVDDSIIMEDLLEFVEVSCVGKLQECYLSLGPTLSESPESLHFNPSKFSEDSYVVEHMIEAQRSMLRYLVFTTIASLYHVVLTRFHQLGEPTTSQRYKRTLTLALRYSLASLQLLHVHLKVLNRYGNADDPLAQSFSFSVFLFLNPFFNVALRRSTMILFTVVGRMMSIDNDAVSNYILYRRTLGRDEAILDMCKEKGLVVEFDGIKDFEDFTMDSPFKKLDGQFGKFRDTRVLVATVANLFSSYRELSKMKALNISFLKMSRPYALGIKYFSYCLNTLFGSEYKLTQPESDANENPDDSLSFAGGSFKNLFDASIDTKSTTPFSFQDFFGTHVDVVKDDIDEYFRKARH